MGDVEPQFAAGSEVELISGGRIGAKMLKQERIKHVFGGLDLP